MLCPSQLRPASSPAFMQQAERLQRGNRPKSSGNEPWRDLPSHFPPCSREVMAPQRPHDHSALRPQCWLLRGWEQRKWCVLLWLSPRAWPAAAQGQNLPLRNRNEANGSPGRPAWEGNPSSARASIPPGNPGQAGPAGRRSLHVRWGCPHLVDRATHAGSSLYSFT